MGHSENGGTLNARIPLAAGGQPGGRAEGAVVLPEPGAGAAEQDAGRLPGRQALPPAPGHPGPEGLPGVRPHKP